MKSQIENIKIYQKVIPTSYLAMFKTILQYYFKWVILKGKKNSQYPLSEQFLCVRKHDLR